jgi:phage gp29-like protein
MSKAILGQTATTEGTPGKLGNEDAQDRVRHDLIKADAESLGKAIRHQLIRPLVGYNFGWDKTLPWFNFLYEKPEDLASLMTVYKGAAEIGQPISAEHVSERFKIPMPKNGETVLRPRKAQTGEANIKSVLKRIVAKYMNQAPADNDAADLIADKLGQDAIGATDAFIATLNELVDGAASLEELRDSIIDLYGNMPPADLGNVISRAMMIADLSGRFDAFQNHGEA